jgi:hypothetical protein
MERGSGVDTLLTQDVCKSSAMQRAGRAGREVSTVNSSFIVHGNTDNVI